MSEVLAAYQRTHRVFARCWKKTLAGRYRTPQCAAGCSSCCEYDMPAVNPAEAHVLAGLVRSRPELADVPAKIRAAAERLRDVVVPAGRSIDSPGEFACVLLGDDGRCRIYDDRPFACIIAHGLDRKACEAGLPTRAGWEMPLPLAMEMIGETLRRMNSLGAAAREFMTSDQDPARRSMPLLLALMLMDESTAPILAEAVQLAERARVPSEVRSAG